MLRVNGELPHPVVQVVGHGEAGNDAGELDSGGQSSDGVGVRRYGAREKELVVATASWCCAEHIGELGFEPLWL